MVQVEHAGIGGAPGAYYIPKKQDEKKDTTWIESGGAQKQAVIPKVYYEQPSTRYKHTLTGEPDAPLKRGMLPSYNPQGSSTGTSSTDVSTDIPQIFETSDRGGSSSWEWESIPYTPPELPDLNIELTKEQLDAILKEAQMYGELGYGGQISSYEMQKESIERETGKAIEDLKPEYWQSQRDTTQAAANAIQRWYQQVNTTGRLTGGQAPYGAGKIEAAGVEGVSQLGKAMNKNIADLIQKKVWAKNDIDTLIANVKKEQGLAIALKNIELQRYKTEQIYNQRQQDFANRMAVSQDARDHQYLEIALNEFRLNAHVAMENLAIARKRLEADIAQTAFENQMAINQLTGGGSRIDTANKFKVTDPATGNDVWVNAQDYARIMATRLEAEAAKDIFTPSERFAIQQAIYKTKYMDPRTKALYAQHDFDVSGVKETPYGNASYGSTGSWDSGTESFNLQNTSTVPKVGTDIYNSLSDPIMFLPGF